ncbi:uncharacterized protein K460DRAFT_355300 [Cucurbitaria berberidis CBS 394.84]|uniref:Uncharacterized protein n=1 Tax=Cucurbitaria berberidis CBS 394.84 TaxID=1168544 RepID=A0A9P4L8M4_9PLEO|nr:uncharacterized protein K460DRAFT_355300 [Cucurbitaria berberidis CBS 394.84]KAF1845482.1 hypothetical protein K460DRAFT_355300 [Cucurbitaria berberidis CBS 394.84]
MAQPYNPTANASMANLEDTSSWIKAELRLSTPDKRATYLDHFHKEVLESSQIRETMILDNAGRIQKAKAKFEEAKRVLEKAEYDAASKLKEHDGKLHGLVQMRDMVEEVMRERGEVKGDAQMGAARTY